jgi:hypothetical protein
VPNTFPAGLGEPINMILSGHSDEAVLVDSEDNGGFRNYMLYVLHLRRKAGLIAGATPDHSGVRLEVLQVNA